MIDIPQILKQYNLRKLTIGVLGGHSALDICLGAKQHGFRTLAVCKKGREKTYAHYYRRRENSGCVDETIVLDEFKDIARPQVIAELQSRNVIFIHNRYFWVYCNFDDIEGNFAVPIFGTRSMLKLEERHIPKNQYYLLGKAGIRMPKIFASAEEIDRLVIVKVNEALRGYERAFFFAASPKDFAARAKELVKKGTITKAALEKAVIEEYIIGAHINLNFFYSPLSKELELMGTDMRRQTNLDGLLRLPADVQLQVLTHIKPTLVETGHVAVTMKESLLEKAFEIGERFVKATQEEHPPGIIGPFALQGAVASEKGREEFVIFDVSLRIPGSPGIAATPYSTYRHCYPVTYGNRIGMEIDRARRAKMLGIVCT